MIRAFLALLLLLLALPAHAAPAIARIMVDPVDGAAAPFDKAIAQKVGSELERMGYEVAGAAPMRLSGKAIAIAGKDGAKFQIAWRLTDASGREIGKFTKSEIAPYKVANPWDALDADTLKRLAKATAIAVEQALEGTAAGSAAILSSANPKPAEPKREPAQPVIRSELTKVFISGVTGAPGDGNVALPNALALYFSHFDVELMPQKAADAYVIEGSVKVRAKNAAQQSVSILWVLKTPKGTELARIAQENAVPAGSLEPRWGKTAEYAAEGAADGLLSTIAGMGKKPPAI